MIFRKETRHAFSSVEVILAIALFSIVILSLAGGLAFTVQSNFETSFQTKASYLAEEGIEAVRAIRNEEYSNLVNGNYGLSLIANEWQFSGTTDVTDEFTRQIQISDFDSTTKAVTSVVTWESQTTGTQSVSYTTYFSDWQYEIDLGGGGGPGPGPGGGEPAGDWSTIVQADTEDILGNQNVRDIIFSNDYIYVAREGATEFIIYDASDPLNINEVGSTSALGNQLWRIFKQGSYVYVVSRNNNQEFAVIDVSNPVSPNVVDTDDLPGNQDARALVVEGNYAYVGRSGGGQDIVVYDISNPSNVNEIGTENTSNVADMVKIGTYLYVSTTNSSNELQVIDVSDPFNPQGVSTLNATGGSQCHAIEQYDKDKVVIGCDDGSLSFIDISDPLNPSEINDYQTPSTDDINDIELGNQDTYLWVLSDDNSNELMVIDITDDSSPSVVGTFDNSGDLNGGVYVPSQDTLYVGGENNLEEISVFQPITFAP